MLRRALTDWLSDMGLIGAGHYAEIDRYIGYYTPYATSHVELDADTPIHREGRNAASALMSAVKRSRLRRPPRPPRVQEPRPK